MLDRPADETVREYILSLIHIQMCIRASPVGSCMVSSEGACAAHYTYGRFRDIPIVAAQPAEVNAQGNAGPLPSFLVPLGGPGAQQQVRGHS